ncbi:hypothetical protein PG2048B_0753 [Bifidobacterium pseudolongum subsp. globosum]|uniref:hypothetical protein n=1 Tax=Bifidobacterium pseudolongum TaxID=1694 RepID=UPI0010210622|nr:hypothetical protein [Bifidobacterium pseudolongum]RYQ24451.1 hypothetical protein PG2048B_0753 [Bifidobacterium pseudolongum subsp. globosum]
MNQELTTGNRLGMQTVPQTFNEQMRFAEVVSQAKGMLPRAYEGNPANVLVAVQYGASLGIEPMAALQNIDVIQGTPTLSAKAVAALVRANGHKLWMNEDEQNMSATCTIVRNDDKEHPVTVTRDKAWAQRMGLLTKDNYKKQPTTMLMWRAVTACANRACPELFLGLGGAYTADELHDMDDMAPVEATVVEDDDAWPESKVELVNRIDRIIDQLGYQGRTHMRVYELLHEAPVTDPLSDIDEVELAMWCEAGDEFLTNRIQTLVQQAKERKANHEEPQTTTEGKQEK